MLVGKCLGGGFPVGAILVTEAVAGTMEKGDHGGTYAGNPLACAAVGAVVHELETTDILENCRKAGEQAFGYLEELRSRLGGKIVEVRGRGLLIGCELASADLTAAVAARCLEEGIIANTIQGNILRIFLALNIYLDVLQEALERIGTILESA